MKKKVIMQKYNGLSTASDKKWIGTNATKVGESVKTALTLLHEGKVVSSGKVA